MSDSIPVPGPAPIDEHALDRDPRAPAPNGGIAFVEGTDHDGDGTGGRSMSERVDWNDMATVDLVRGVQLGGDEAREALFRRYSARVHALARRRMGRKLRVNMDSLDITQDALTEAVQAIQTYETRENSDLTRWLKKIVKHRISSSAKFFNAERRTKEREIAIDRAPDGSRGFEPADAGATPSMDARRTERREILEECLAKLPEHYRRLIRLRDYEDLSWDDTAAKIGAASPDSARMMHARARELLTKLLRARGIR